MLGLKVFISSPDDVGEEREFAREVVRDELPVRPHLRGRVHLDVVSWDDPHSPATMDARLTPQDAVNRGLPKPSQCDVVVVVLWSRLGTPLPREFRKGDSGRYLSGTEWEFEDACCAQPGPVVLLYRRTERPKVELDDPDLPEKTKQYGLVRDFFARFRGPDGSLTHSVTSYQTPGEFRQLLGRNLEDIVWQRVQAMDVPSSAPVDASVALRRESPYPGLRAFTENDAAIFFGREREALILERRLREAEPGFVAVVGASGTGKSSLIRAGLIPRLSGGHDDRHGWHFLIMRPAELGDDPFLPLAGPLLAMLPPGRRPARAAELARQLREEPERITERAEQVLAGEPDWARLVLVVDQLEELFTTVAEEHRGAFVKLLAGAADHSCLRVLATLREDFLSRCAAEPELATLLQAGTFVLGPPGPAALIDMIRKPAEWAGLELEDGLADQILRDGGDASGALPLVAFCLQDLHRRRDATAGRLTLDNYNARGGLHGAVGRRAAELLDDLRRAEGPDLDAALLEVFRAVIRVDAAGIATRG